MPNAKSSTLLGLSPSVNVMLMRGLLRALMGLGLAVFPCRSARLFQDIGVDGAAAGI